MVDIVTPMILTVAILVIAFLCSMLHNGQFSGRIFLAVISIGIAVLVWLPVMPAWMIIFSVFSIVGIFFSGGAESE